MRVMVLVKATEQSEANVMPSEKLLMAMGDYNQQLIDAGLMLAGEGITPSSQGKRVKFTGKDRIVRDGPFAETKELVSGFWIWKVESMDEAVEWVKKMPGFGEGEEIEIRRVSEPEDFGEAFTPELQAKEDAMRAQTEARNS